MHKSCPSPSRPAATGVWSIDHAPRICVHSSRQQVVDGAVSMEKPMHVCRDQVKMGKWEWEWESIDVRLHCSVYRCREQFATQPVGDLFTSRRSKNECKHITITVPSGDSEGNGPTTTGHSPLAWTRWLMARLISAPPWLMAHLSPYFPLLSTPYRATVQESTSVKVSQRCPRHRARSAWGPKPCIAVMGCL